MGDTTDGSRRRRFLAGLVSGSAIATAGITAATTLQRSTRAGTWGGRIRYRGPRNVTGPADRALPQVPVAVDDDGYLHGRWPSSTEGQVPVEVIGGVRYSPEWFRYCEAEEHPGLRPAAGQDTLLRAAPDPPYVWQAAALTPGEPLHVSAFSDYATWGNGVGTDGLGKPAMATWRSQGPVPTIRVQVLRSGRVPDVAGDDAWVRASTDRSFVAWRADCPNYCAITAFKAYESSERFDAGDLVYCPRHQSLFDPFEVVESTFVAPRWETN